MAFIKVEVVFNLDEGFTSLLFAPRDDDEEHRQHLDTILRCFLDTSLMRRGGFVPGALRIDVKLPPEEASDSDIKQ
jgi:hypothetical protein